MAPSVSPSPVNLRRPIYSVPSPIKKKFNTAAIHGFFFMLLLLWNVGYTVKTKKPARTSHFSIEFEIASFIKWKKGIVGDFPEIIVGIGKIGAVSTPKYFLRLFD